MKNLKYALTVISLLLFTVTFSQKDKSKLFEGHIFYDVKVEGDIEPNMAARMPSKFNIYFKGEKIRAEQVSSMGNSVVISDFASKEQIILLDMMGQKYAIKSTKEETEKGLEGTPTATIDRKEGAKTIAGYNCKYAEYNVDGKTSSVYYTEDLSIPNSNWYSQFKDMSNVLLEYTQVVGEDDEIKLITTATEVKQEKVKDSMFTVPAGYEQISITDFRKMLGQ